MNEILAVIGGSGLYDIPGLTGLERLAVETPYGPPSDEVTRGTLDDGTAVLFLPRHGRGHRLAPHAINYRANICALKKLGATQVLSVSAVGSMKESIAPGDLLVVDQLIDLTRRRVSTFFDRDVAAHVAFADPICPALATALGDALEALAAEIPEPERPRVHRTGTYLCIDGPQFSTRAESRVYRSWGVDAIGMTNMPEAKLAREAELPYATLALITDYDCWHESEDAVEVKAVLERLKTMVTHARSVVPRLARSLPPATDSIASGALDSAVMTSPDHMPPKLHEELRWLLPQL